MRDLPRYEEFRDAVEALLVISNSLQDFTSELKNNNHYKHIRNNARMELQSIYNEVSRKFKLPQIPVYLPIRKKIWNRGQAHTMNGIPTEIRVYPIEGPAGISYRYWLPQHITICSKLAVFEIFKHEIAHVISAVQNGVMDDHDEAFVEAYDVINMYFSANGFDSLIDPTLELFGVPSYSYAAKVAMSRGVEWARPQKVSGAGCLILAGTFLFTLILILICGN